MNSGRLNEDHAAPLRIALAGFGAVGRQLAERFKDNQLPGATLTAVSARNLDKAADTLAAIGLHVPVVPLQELMDYADIVVECATAESFAEIAETAMRAGKILVAVSVAGLVQCPDLADLARRYGGRVRVASGGLPGLDAVRAVRECHISKVKLCTTFRPESLAHEPVVQKLGFDFTKSPVTKAKVFTGTGREAALAFPRHFNVAVALSLCGIGFDDTDIEVWVDPDVEGAVQHIEVVADDADLTLISRNRPSTNPRTSRIVASSIMATLRSYTEPIQIGT
ncbi:aspartate dehydrogenase domain-containing protein [Burkholderia cepacia]|uniref:aspartate dehydrogenase domain-containing protein n=1 Tax=Burkholderia cepacia TaxID=292 RepID=UPI002AB71E37|nr:aspartate dehydrogenase domain-containing protein [Burkholderia cepacia]